MSDLPRVSSRTRSVASLAGLALALSCARPARAEDLDGFGAWLWKEYRQGLYHRAPRLPRISLRIQSDTRTSSRSEIGITQQFLRVGLWIEPTSWLAISTNGTVLGDRQADGQFAFEARLEEELFFLPRIGPVQIIDRNRLEWRYRQDQPSMLRYRNMLRLQYQPDGLRFRPFVWNEWFVDARKGWNENWVGAGVNFVITGNVLLDVGYQLRLRDKGEFWLRDHNLILNLLVTVPAPRR